MATTTKKASTRKRAAKKHTATAEQPEQQPAPEPEPEQSDDEQVPDGTLFIERDAEGNDVLLISGTKEDDE